MASNRVHGPMAYLVVAVTLAGSVVVPGATLRAQRVAATTREVPRETQRVTVNVDGAPLDAVLRAIAQQAGLVPVFDDALVTPATRVTLHVREISAEEAFEQALHGTGLRALVRAKGQVVIVRETNHAIAAGTIEGRVTVAASKQAVPRAKVRLDATDRVVETDAKGVYQLSNVSAGTHTVTVRALGYAKAVRNVEVRDGATITADIALDPSALPLNQVVVTGTVIPTEMKAIPTAMTVITAKQIEQRGITHLDQLFRGDIPGLFAVNSGSGKVLGQFTMFSRGATALDGFEKTNPIKTYVDGVEDDKALTQIDPASIERIEVLTGPQASTIYGSNALNGVIQIFTKRGTSNKPQLTFNLRSGVIENSFNSAKAPVHEYNGQLSGISGIVSYNIGGLWNHTGSWTPAIRETKTGVNGGMRMDLPTSAGPVKLDVSLTRNYIRNLQTGAPEQSGVAYWQSGYYRPKYTRDLYRHGDLNRTETSTDEGMSGALSHSVGTWFSHTFTVGRTGGTYKVASATKSYGQINTEDTTLFYQVTHAFRHSLQYTATINVTPVSMISATLTGGADTWETPVNTAYSTPTTSLKGYSAGSIYSNTDHNTGAFMQTRIGLFDKLFLTYGLRAEWNPAFGAEATPNYAPQYGVAYATDVGAVTFKLRASYGKSTRPPTSDQKVGVDVEPTDDVLVPVYGIFPTRLANPLLGPVNQSGGEGGFELYFANGASLSVTRFNQTVNDLITEVPGVDSIRSLNPNPLFFGSSTCAQLLASHVGGYCSSVDAQGYAYFPQKQNLNVAGVRNQGWEINGSYILGRLTATGTYSWTKSRSLGVTQRFARVFGEQVLGGYNSQYAKGATFNLLPEHTWAAGLSYNTARMNLSMNLTGVGQIENNWSDLLQNHTIDYIRLKSDRWIITTPQGGLHIKNNGYSMADISASYRVTSSVTGTLLIQNAGNHYSTDDNAQYATIGRQSKLGLRIGL